VVFNHHGRGVVGAGLVQTSGALHLLSHLWRGEAFLN
jgi:hypothetical protein